jgi:nucleotide-binding universal stress UspA family protein
LGLERSFYRLEEEELIMTSGADSGHDQDLMGPRIVVGVDGSASSMRALAWATTEAQLRGAALEVVHADWARREALEALAPGMLSDEQSVLDRAVVRARALAPSITVAGWLSDPPAGKALIQASDGAEMLVVGSRGLSGLKELALGSVSSECAHHAHCPVVIVPPAIRRPGGSSSQDLVGASAGPNSEPTRAG